jgi:surfactin synthase thioesterase subunit
LLVPTSLSAFDLKEPLVSSYNYTLYRKRMLGNRTFSAFWVTNSCGSAMFNSFANPMKAPQSAWFESSSATHEPSLQLFCFPYAGGNAQVYRSWQYQLAEQVRLSLVHLPGRAKRLGLPSYTQLRPLVEALADAMASVDSGPCAFWGHSMGALISFELARELRRRGEALPRALFVSGRAAPQFSKSDPPICNLPEREFIAELRRLNGTPRELLEDPETMSLFLPTIRADFHLVETYIYKPEPPLSCAIYAYGGLQDTDVSANSLNAWQEQTCLKFRSRMLPGDHFFIHSSAANLIHVLRRDLEDELLQLTNT